MPLTQEAAQMIEGLITQSDLRILKDKATNIVKDLKNEGFDEDDVKQYLKEEITSIVLYEFL